MDGLFSNVNNMFGDRNGVCGGISFIWILLFLYLIFCTNIFRCIDPTWLILLLLLIVFWDKLGSAIRFCNIGRGCGCGCGCEKHTCR